MVDGRCLIVGGDDALLRFDVVCIAIGDVKYVYNLVRISSLWKY